MKWNKGKKLLGAAALTAATVLVVTGVINRYNTASQAQEVFTQIKTMASESSTTPINFLEIVDDVSVFDDNTQSVGEEELAYMVGGSEPFRDYLKELAEASWGVVKDSSFSVANASALDTYKAAFDALVSALADKNLIDVSGAADGYPLSVVEITSYLPLDEAANGDKVIVGITPETVSDGYFVPAANGCYIKNSSGAFEYVGPAGGNGAIATTSLDSSLDESITEDTAEDEETDEDDADIDTDDEDTDADDIDNPADPDGSAGTNPADQAAPVTPDTPTTGDQNTNTAPDTTTPENGGGSSGTTPAQGTQDGGGDTNQNIDATPGDGSAAPGADSGSGNGSDAVQTPDNTGAAPAAVDAPDENTADTTDASSSPRWTIERRTVKLKQLAADASDGASGTQDGGEEDPGDDTATVAIMYADTPQYFYNYYEEVPDGAADTAEPANGTPVYKVTYQTIQNNEWLKQYVFGASSAADSSSVNLNVYAVKTDDSTIAAKIATADLVYLNADGTIVSSTSSTSSSSTSTVATEINETVAQALLKRVVDKNNRLACMVNLDVYNGYKAGNNNSNLAKLVLSLYQQSVESVYSGKDDSIITSTNWASDISSSTWKEVVTSSGKWFATANQGGNSTGRFVKNNVFFTTTLLPTVDSLGTTSGSTLETSIRDYNSAGDAFEDVWVRIEQENYERTQQGNSSGSVSAIINAATCIQTILTYSSEPAVIAKGSIKVLELEPCYAFTYAATTRDDDAAVEKKLEAFKEKFLPDDASVDIEIVGMTTSEFCGKIMDINTEYDMIYIGSNTDLMNRVEVSTGDYCTVYNDKSLCGIAYLHTGDQTVLNAMSGLLARNDGTYRFSGNDILKDQKDKLIDFLKSGAPIVVADDFFTYDGTTGSINGISTGSLGTTVTVNGTDYTRYGILDNSTYLYQAVKEACGDGTWDGTTWNAAAWENRTYKNFLPVGDVNQSTFAQWINQPKLSIQLMSQPVEYTYTTKEINGVSVIDSYTCMSPDENDGNYYLTYEFIISNLSTVNPTSSNYTVYLAVDANMDGRFSKTTEDLGSLVVTDLNTNQQIDYRELKLGVPYQVTRELPQEFIGCINWQLEVEENGNSSLRGEITGMTAVKEEKQTIRILQVYNERNSSGNIQSKLENEPNNMWTILLNNVPDFDVEMTSVSLGNYFSNKTDAELGIQSLETYDMLILGFSDNFGYYQSSFNQDRLQAIVDYADSGKCVLFSHDCTNWENGSGQNGKLNMTIRDLTGLDRYGVTVYRTTNSALFNSNNKIKDGLEIVKSSLSELTDYLFGASGLNGYNRDIAFKANTNQTAMVKETQAITYSGSEHNMSDANKASLYRYLGYSSSLDGTWINQNDTQIEKVNQGAITEYPYRLSDTISVSQTHAQYYQLDLESDSDEDGEGDIVVWYTINNSVKGTLNDIYDYSPNDVRNNYYIYNRGNITYTGMGHSNIDGNAEEIRLFINTMIAAYRVSMKSPILNIVESPTDLTDKSYASVPYDAAVDNNATTYRVYFTAEDNNFISDAAKVINYKLYVADGAGDTEITPSAGVTEKVSEKTGQWKVYLASNDTEALSLTSGEVYYVDVPLDESFINKKSVDLYVEVQAEITKRNKVETSAKVYDSIKINQLQLFDLD